MKETVKITISCLKEEVEWYREQISLHNLLSEDDRISRKAAHLMNERKLSEYERVISDLEFPVTRFALNGRKSKVNLDQLFR